jgi:hypothetical protein
MRAWTDFRGRIGLGAEPPACGVVLLAQGPAQELRRHVSALARLAYDNQTLLVPGVPEAETEAERLVAMHRFSAAVAQCLVDEALN